MKLSQAKKITAILMRRGEKSLAKTFASSVTGKTAQDELNDIINENGSDRGVKNSKGEGSKSGNELVRKQRENNPARNVKKGNGKSDPVGKEFDSKKRNAEVKKA
jgi:hypothetical protein